jgi:hypothetical protein
VTPEELADSIAHDLVSPPEDDDGPFVRAEIWRRLAVAKRAAHLCFACGGTREDAIAAASEALRDVP